MYVVIIYSYIQYIQKNENQIEAQHNNNFFKKKLNHAYIERSSHLMVVGITKKDEWIDV